MTTVAYDFCKPGPLASHRENRFADWLRSACALATKNWAKQLPFAAEWTFHGCDIRKQEDCLTQISDPAVAHRLEMSAGNLATLLIMPRGLVLGIASGMVGDTNAPAPERELTPVEEGLFEYFVNQFLLPPLHESWPGPDGMRLEMKQGEPRQKWGRIFAPDDAVVSCHFLLTGPFGVQEWFWLLPREGLLGLLEQSSQAAGAAPVDTARTKPQLQERVQELPVEVTVVLGSVDVRLSQLSHLRVGDVIVLNQRVSETMTAFLAGEKKFRGWPGRIGVSQAFQIDSFLNR